MKLSLARIRTIVVLLLGLIAIGAWQYSFLRPESKVEAGYVPTAGTGINRDLKFFYFLYHLNLFPIGTDAEVQADTDVEAERLLHDAPKQLRQDEGTTFRSGDRARAYLYFVDAWIHHRALNASLKPAHSLAFVVALMGLFAAFVRIKRSVHGALLVALIGSDPLQLAAVYKQENVFSWMITILVAVLALHVPLLEKPKAGGKSIYPWIAAVATGALIGCVRNVRSEPTVVMFGALLIYASMSWISRKKRAALAFIMALSLTSTTFLTRAFLDAKFHKAHATVAAVGGIPYDGPRAYYHEFWHVIFCGLGDFDTTKGYVWDDRRAYESVLPQMQALHPEIQLRPVWEQGPSYDGAGKYPIFYFERGGYHELIRDKVVGDIKADPRWYVRILYKRIERALDQTTPVGMAFANSSTYVGSRLLGWLWLPLLVFCLGARRHTYAKLLVFSLPLTIAPLLVYSGGGMTYYSLYHLFAAFVALALLAEGLRHAWRTRYRAQQWGA